MKAAVNDQATPQPHLLVHWGDALVGTVTSPDGGRNLQFRYQPGANRVISHALPLTTELQDGSFFAKLLPEAAERERLAAVLGVSADNDFALLTAIGGDCAGALSLTFPSLSHVPPRARVSRDRRLTHALCVQLQTAGALSTIVHEGLRLSLAGAQEKLPVILRGGELFLPEDTEPSTHILKLPSQSLRGLIDNEHFIMALAREAGLSVAPVALHTLPTGDTALLVERFDRRDGQRIHQEDFCQATGRSQHEKYETEGGPSLQEIVAVIRAACTAPARDIEALFRLVAFNTLVGNNDGHAKNIALLRDDIIRLAPAYDLVCTRAWPQLSADLAIRIGGRRRAGDIDAAAWDDEARACQVAPRLVRDIVRDTLAKVETAAPAAAATLMASGQTAKTPIRAALSAVTKHCHWARRAGKSGGDSK